MRLRQDDLSINLGDGLDWSVAHEMHSLTLRPKFNRPQRHQEMDFLTKMIVRITESNRNQAGQTMTEYVLIIAAIAVAGYVAYQGLETGINGVIAKVTGSLNAA
jgi:Flp pilus assembly pilin Flp